MVGCLHGGFGAGLVVLEAVQEIFDGAGKHPVVVLKGDDAGGLVCNHA